MSEKRKSTLSAKVLTILIIVLFAGACACFVYAVCTGTLSKEIMAEVDEINASEAAATATAGTPADSEPDTSVPATTGTPDKNDAVANASFIVAPSYKAKGAVDANGEKVDLRAYFGSGFASYGGHLNFEGHRFTLDMGVSANSDSSKGEYGFVSMTEIELKFDNSDVTTASFTLDGKDVTSIDVPMDDIVVTFVLAD